MSAWLLTIIIALPPGEHQDVWLGGSQRVRQTYTTTLAECLERGNRVVEDYKMRGVKAVNVCLEVGKPVGE